MTWVAGPKGRAEVELAERRAGEELAGIGRDRWQEEPEEPVSPEEAEDHCRARRPRG